MRTSIEFMMPLQIETWMEKIGFGMEKYRFLDLIWDEFLRICTFRSYRGERHKSIIFVVPGGLSRPSEDCKIEEQIIKNQAKFEAQDVVPLGIEFWCILEGFERQLGWENRSKIHLEIGPEGDR